MITLAIAAAFFYFAQQNYALFNGHSGLSPAFRRRASSASTGAIRCPSTISVCWSRRPAYAAVLYCARSTFGLALQAIRDNPPAHARGRLSTSPRTRSSPISAPASSPGSPACCWSGSTAASRRARSSVGQAVERAGHRGDRRPAPSDRPLRRRRLRHPDPDLRHRYRRRRAVQYVDRRWSFWSIVFVSPDGLLGLVGEAQAAPCRGVLALPRVGGSVTSSTNRISNQGRNRMSDKSTPASRRSALAAGTDGRRRRRLRRGLHQDRRCWRRSRARSRSSARTACAAR